MCVVVDFDKRFLKHIRSHVFITMEEMENKAVDLEVAAAPLSLEGDSEGDET